MPKTESELWFEGYLRQQRLSGADDPEPDLRIEKRPDYLVSNGDDSAVCEVKEFDASGMQRRVDAGHNSTISLSSDEVYGDIRRKVRAAAVQLKPLAGGDVPLMVVLANPNGVLLGLDVQHVQGALSGNPTFGGPYEPSTGTITTVRPVRGRDGKLTNDHQYLSAVALLHKRSHAADFNHAWFAERGFAVRASGLTTAAQMAELVTLAEGKPDGPPGFYYWVELMHTVSAMDGISPKVASTLFNGTHDREYEPDAKGFYSQVS